MHRKQSPSDEWTTDSAWTATRLPVESASALPAACYVNDDFYDLELERVWGTSWVCVATTDELGPPGTLGAKDGARRLLVRNVAGRSILITSDEDGELRAFHNACRHRGTQLAACDASIASVIRCPYHRWGYNIVGDLIATPRFEDVALTDFDRADYPLHTVRIGSWGPLVFVSLDDEAPSLSSWLGDLPQRLGGYQLDGWSERDRVDVTINANWKLISENFQEYYHLPFVHPELAKVSRVEDHYRFQGPGMYCGQCTTPVSGDERDDWTAMPPAPALSESDAASGRFLALFPNVLLSILPNHVFAMILQPDGPGRTLEQGIWFVPPTSNPSDSQFAATREFWLEVNSEDIDIVERGQRGLTAGHYTPGRLSARFEEPLHRFHNMLADRITGVDRIPAGDASDEVDLYGAGVNPLPWRPPPPAIRRAAAN